jgi:uncharacterized membrane protein
MEKLMFLGLALVFIGMLFLIISSVSMALTGKAKGKAEVGFGGFVGPIPFGFFTGKRVFWMWLLMLVMGLIFWLLARKLI